MPSRSEMDRPAIVAVALLGIALIAASVPFLDTASAGGKDFLVTWTEAEAGSAQAATGPQGTTTTLRVPLTDSLPSNATVALEACTDGAQPPLGQPATIDWALFEGDEEVERGTLQCGDGPVRVAQEARPDVGEASAPSQAAAEQDAYAAGENETVEFRLEFSWTRPAGATGPLPLPQPPFAATVSLTLEEWIATANEADPEVPR